MRQSEIIRYSAPGKLFILGEYGVLAGGWTLVAAMSRRVLASRLPVATKYRAIGAGARISLALPRSVLASIDKSTPSRHETIGHFETDVRSFFDGRQKLGLGSSAASVVALSAATLHRKSISPTVDRVFETAFRAHRLLQKGRGSGADVAASTYGGMLAYRLDESTPPFNILNEQAIFEGERRLVGTRIVPGLVWPDELTFRAVWTGTSASSTTLIGRIEPMFLKCPEEVSAIFSEISKTAEAGISALRSGNSSAFIQIIAKADGLMDELGKLTGAQIITERHRELRRVAERHGVVAKPSGAGGGDFSLLVGQRDARWDLIEHALPTGCTLIEMKLDNHGVCQNHAAFARPS